MTKRDMAKLIGQRMSVHAQDVAPFIEEVLASILEALLTEGRLELRNFGVFEVKERKPRKGRNPRTGERVDVPARRVVTFTAGKDMAKKVAQKFAQQTTQDKEGIAS